jgi:RNA polymerase sigma-70 factor (ECF subfamily)
VDAPTRPEDQLESLIDRYKPELLRFAGGLIGGHGSAEDVVQETMLRAWRHLASLPPDENGRRRWLYAVARRIVIDMVRRRRARPTEVPEISYQDLAGEGDPTSESVIAGMALRQAFADLDPNRRAVVAELYFEGRSITETAAKLRIPVGTVKSRAHYAVVRLRAAATGVH